MPHRPEQVNELLREKIGEFLISDFEPPTGALVTITRVEVTTDMQQAKIYISVLPENNRGTILESLRRATPRIRRFLFRDLTFHSTPRLIFLLDESEIRAQGIESLLDSLGRN